MTWQVSVLLVAAFALIAATAFGLRCLQAKMAALRRESEDLAAKLAAVGEFLRGSKTLQPELAEFNKRPSELNGHGFALERWKSLRDRIRYQRWRASEDKRSKLEKRDESFTDALDDEREAKVRVNARPFLAILRQKLPYVVSQDHIDWFEQSDHARAFLEWLIVDVERGLKEKPPAELESLKALVFGK